MCLCKIINIKKNYSVYEAYSDIRSFWPLISESRHKTVKAEDENPHAAESNRQALVTQVYAVECTVTKAGGEGVTSTELGSLSASHLPLLCLPHAHLLLCSRTHCALSVFSLSSSLVFVQ